MKNTNVNKQIVRLFAYLHDIGRVSNGTEPIHGEKACGILREFKSKLYLNTLKDDDFDKLCTAISVHNKVRKTGDLTIDLCLDADRLDLSRVGIKPNPKMMATEIGEYFAEHLHLLHPNWW